MNATDARTAGTTASSPSEQMEALIRIRRNFFISICAALSAACAGVRRFLTRPSRRELLNRLSVTEQLLSEACDYAIRREKNFNENFQRLAVETGELRAQVARLKKENSESEPLRAHVMQLRCENSDPAQLGRVGWQVSAFIPDDVLSRVRAGGPAAQDEFTIRVARTLVDNALRGIFVRNAAGNCTALVWEPLGVGEDGKPSKKSVVSAWFEGDPRRPGLIMNSSDEPAIRRMLGVPGADEAAVDDACRKHFLTAPSRVTEHTSDQRELTEADQASAPCRSSVDRDGNWLDKWGACKVCDGEIPHGHTNNCDIYKLECKIAELTRLLEVTSSNASHPAGRKDQ